MTPSDHEVVLFALHGRRQDQIGIFRRVGDEQLAHHHEQVFALQPLDDLGLRRRLRDRVRVVDEQRHHRRDRVPARR